MRSRILAKPEQREAIAATGRQVAGGTPEEFREFIRVETAKWARAVKDANIQPE